MQKHELWARKTAVWVLVRPLVEPEPRGAWVPQHHIYDNLIYKTVLMSPDVSRLLVHKSCWPWRSWTLTAVHRGRRLGKLKWLTEQEPEQRYISTSRPVGGAKDLKTEKWQNLTLNWQSKVVVVVVKVVLSGGSWRILLLPEWLHLYSPRLLKCLDGRIAGQRTDQTDDLRQDGGQQEVGGDLSRALLDGGAACPPADPSTGDETDRRRDRDISSRTCSFWNWFSDSASW